MKITIRPLGRGRFAASIGQRVLCQGKTPCFTAARILQAEGIPDATPITMTHEGSDIVAMQSIIGEAASLIVVETDTHGPEFKRYRPMSAQVPRQRVRQEARTAVTESEVGGPRRKPEQLCLWSHSLPNQVVSPRVRLSPMMTAKARKVSIIGPRPKQLSLFAPHLLGEHTQ